MFDQQYPHLTSWIPGGDGWIEMGQDEFSRSLVRILDFGGMIWESDQRYATIDETLAAAEQALPGEITKARQLTNAMMRTIEEIENSALSYAFLGES